MSLSCSLGSCLGFHFVLSSCQPSFVKESKSVREISIAFSLFQEGCIIQVCPSRCPFCAWFLIFHSSSLFLLWMVQPESGGTYNCSTQVSASLLYGAVCFQTRVEWLTIVLGTMLLCPCLFAPLPIKLLICGCVCAHYVLLYVTSDLKLDLEIKHNRDTGAWRESEKSKMWKTW